MFNGRQLSRITDRQKQSFINLLLKKDVSSKEAQEMIEQTDSDDCSYAIFSAILADLMQRPAANWKVVANNLKTMGNLKQELGKIKNSDNS